MTPSELLYTYSSHKGRYWRFRHPTVGDVKLPGRPGESAFHTRYAELLAQVEKAPAPLPTSSMAWLIRRYRASDEFKALSDATQLDYGKTLDILDAELGRESYRLVSRAMVKAVRDDYAETPRKAHKIKQMVSALYGWADQEELVPEGYNPAAKLKRLKRKGGDREYVVWSESEIALFLGADVPKPVKTAVMLALYTGQRANDVVRMTWKDFQGDMIRVRQQKTRTPLEIACHTRLRAYLEALRADLDREKKRGVVIVTSEAGKPYNANSLGSAIYRAVQSIKEMPSNRSLHGVRYASGSTMEEAGCTIGEIESVLGHNTFKMALKYATQRLRAKAAIAKMEAAEGA